MVTTVLSSPPASLLFSLEGKDMLFMLKMNLHPNVLMNMPTDDPNISVHLRQMRIMQEGAGIALPSFPCSESATYGSTSFVIKKRITHHMCKLYS